MAVKVKRTETFGMVPGKASLRDDCTVGAFDPLHLCPKPEEASFNPDFFSCAV